MLLFLRGRFLRVVFRHLNTITWRELVLVLAIHFVTSWVLCFSAEPNAEYVQADTFWWFYLVTITTVGYGDFSPSEFWSRLVVAIYIMPIGISMMGVVIGKIAAALVDFADKIRRGLMDLDIEDHSIVVGDGSQHTIDLLRNLILDTTVGKVVLVSVRDTNPLNGELDGFVSGDVNDPIIQARACFTKAKRVIVLGDDDTTVTGRTIAVMACTTEDTEIVAYFQHGSSALRLDTQTPERVRTVASVSMDLVVQEVLDPGAAAFVKELLRNGQGGTYVRCLVPDGVQTTWAKLGAMLMELDLNPLCLYVDGTPVAMPKGSSPIKAGDCLGIAVEQRSDLDSIDWNMLRLQAA